MLHFTSNFLFPFFMLFILTNVAADNKHSAANANNTNWHKKLAAPADGGKNIEKAENLNKKEMLKKGENKKQTQAINLKKEQNEKSNAPNNKATKILHDSAASKIAKKSKIPKSVCYEKCCERKLAERREQCKKHEGTKARRVLANSSAAAGEVRVKRADYYHDACDNPVDGYYYCRECDVDCDSADVHEGNSSEYSCGECQNDVRTREQFETNTFYCSQCKERKTNSEVYVWRKLAEGTEGQEDDSDDEDPCESVENESDSYAVKCNECLTPASCANLKHHKPSYIDCEWNQDEGCEKWVKYNKNGDFYDE